MVLEERCLRAIARFVHTYMADELPLPPVIRALADGGAAKRRAVGEAEGRKWAADRKMGYFETSAKDGDGVGALFESLFSQAMAR